MSSSTEFIFQPYKPDMYRDYLKESFPHDERNGLYKAPKLPAVKLGKALMKDTRISSPNDVIAMHKDGGTFGSKLVIFTGNKCFYDDGEFLLEDVAEVQAQGNKMIVFTSQKGQYLPHEFKVKNETVAFSLKKVLEGIARYDPKSDELVQNAYEGFSNTEIDWLNLRDEIMRTIDMLYRRYNDGKLSMMEYESKKEELLSRL